MRQYWQQSKLRWAVIIAAASASYISSSGSELLRAQLGVLAWKVSLVCIGVILAHQFRKQLFPYLDLSETVKQDDTRSGLFFLGVMVFTAAIVLALTGGL